MKLKPPAGICIAASSCGSVGSGASPATMAFSLEQQRDERRVGLGGQRAGVARRHRRAHDVEQRARRLAAVLAHERVAFQRRAERAVGEVGAVAHGAARVVDGAAGFGLLRP